MCRRASCCATSQPNASSPKKIFPIPATRIRRSFIAQAARLHPRRRKIGGPVAAAFRDRGRDRPPARARVAPRLSTSCITDSMIAILPLSAMSITSARFFGRMRTRSPAFNETPPTVTCSSGFCGLKNSSSAAACARAAHRAVHFQHVGLGEIFRPLENAARVFVHLAHLRFLVVGHRLDAQA